MTMAAVSDYHQYVNPAKLEALHGIGMGEAFAGAEGEWLYDRRGEAYLDLAAGFGAATLGHRPRAPIAALQRVLRAGEPFNAVLSVPRLASELARALCEIAGGSLSKVYYCSGGAEAVETAIKFARAATRRTRILSVAGGYHGLTGDATAITGHPHWRSLSPPMDRDCLVLPFADPCALEQAMIEHAPAALIVEVVQGMAGARAWPAGQLREVSRSCKARGVLLIVDEVLTGIGRTGSWFAFQAEAGVEPDLVITSKGLSAGIVPIAAVLMTDEIYRDVFGRHPTIQSNTFEGHALGAAAGLAVIRTIRRRRLLDRVARVSARLREVLARTPGVQEVRGRGLLLGFCMDGEVAAAQEERASACWLGLIESGVLTVRAAHDPRYIKLTPPFTLSDASVALFERALAAVVALPSGAEGC